MQEPIFFEPIYKDYIWGGNRLKNDLQKNTPFEKTAESWEISSNKNGETIIQNGEYQGKTIDAIWENKEIRKKLFGTKTENLEKFPLLVKFIDAETNLSVQVHPDDIYAKERENSLGKTEMWYIIDCKPDAQIIYGLKKGILKKKLPNILTSKKIVDHLNFVNVEPGDCIYIPSGTIHAILGDTLICEIQQNSDLTYRVYDWERVGKDGKSRELHTQKAIDVTQVEQELKIERTKTMKTGKKEIINSPYFKIDKLKIENNVTEESNPETFFILNVVKGNGKIKVQEREYSLKLGDSFIIPSNLGKYELKGNLEILKTYLT